MLRDDGWNGRASKERAKRKSEKARHPVERHPGTEDKGKLGLKTLQESIDDQLPRINTSSIGHDSCLVITSTSHPPISQKRSTTIALVVAFARESINMTM